MDGLGTDSLTEAILSEALTHPDDGASLAELLAEVRQIGAHVAEIHAELGRYRPILEAYLRPDASGPAAWAVRKVLAKAERNGN